MANEQNKKLVSVRDLNFKYNNDYILNDINLDIFKGKNVAILGRNGGGKSTLVKVMLGFLKKNSGSIKFFTNDNKIGYLPQIREFDTSFPINIFDLVISGLTNKKNLFRKFNKEEKKQAETLLKEFDIFHLKNKLINEVSGGQLQRELIFLDEPESFLDKEFEFKLFEKIKKLSDSTIVVISHELEKIYDYIDSIFVVEGNIRVFEKKEDYVCSNPYLHSHK